MFIIGWVTALMAPFFLALSYFGWLRSDRLEEAVGLDTSYSNSFHNKINSNNANLEPDEIYNGTTREFFDPVNNIEGVDCLE